MLSQRIRNLTPYVPGEQPRDRRYLKLNTNENPYPPSPAALEALRAVDPDLLRRYPDPLASDLRQAVARHFGVQADWVFAGNGSDEVLSFAFFAFFDSGRGPLLFPQHTYSFYPVYCAYYGIDYLRLPLAPDFGIRVEDFIPREPVCGAIFPNPNAPTGRLLPLEAVASLLERFPADRVVVVDEAYIDFGGRSAVPLTRRHPNLLVTMTFSKRWALAGLRLGCAIGQPALIGALLSAKDAFNSYPVDALAQRIGALAIADEPYYRGISERIVATRSAFVDRLEALGWEVLPSAANFVFTRRRGLAGDEIYARLKAQGILVRHFPAAGIADFVRITIGRDEEMAHLAEALARLG
jgi:histidinol-phosphate aminotransferase